MCVCYTTYLNVAINLLLHGIPKAKLCMALDTVFLSNFNQFNSRPPIFFIQQNFPQYTAIVNKLECWR